MYLDIRVILQNSPQLLQVGLKSKLVYLNLFYVLSWSRHSSCLWVRIIVLNFTEKGSVFFKSACP